MWEWKPVWVTILRLVFQSIKFSPVGHKLARSNFSFTIEAADGVAPGENLYSYEGASRAVTKWTSNYIQVDYSDSLLEGSLKMYHGSSEHQVYVCEKDNCNIFVPGLIINILEGWTECYRVYKMQ